MCLLFSFFSSDFFLEVGGSFLVFLGRVGGCWVGGGYGRCAVCEVDGEVGKNGTERLAREGERKRGGGARERRGEEKKEEESVPCLSVLARA